MGRSASSLAAAAEQLTSTAKTMAVNAQQTSQRVFSVSSASEEIGCNIHSVASAAEEMSTSIREIASSASDAAKVAGEAVDAASKANATMSRLGESSGRIGEIVKLITGIAGQTHLLALNAAIEAARAGAAGKGFAVVANEVKELAKETAKATEDIGRKIEIIQSDSRAAVEAISAIGDTIGRISGLQTTIAGAVQQQTQTTNEISRSTSDVANGSGEITRSITEVAAAAQSTSDGASYTERAALELSRMATEMQEFVSRFHYGEAVPAVPARAAAAAWPDRMVQ
ncbi:MAG: methyl-accepting chemotaxis protein [Acidobacteriaceae bacterium]